jgi:FixJ family two-component response regulator
MSRSESVVYVVEDDPSFRKSLERLLRASGFEAVTFESATAFLAQPCDRRPACLLLDVMLPDIDGLNLQRELTARGSSLPVVFMTGHGSIPMGVQAMKQGAVDAQNRTRAAGEDRVRALVVTLTPREKEVLRWVITGKLNKQIAIALGTAEKTVKVHRGRVMQKLGVLSVAELVRLAEQANIPPAV